MSRTKSAVSLLISRYREERRFLRDNREEIALINGQMLKSMVSIGVIVLTILIVFSIFVPAFGDLTLAYTLSWLVSTVAFMIYSKPRSYCIVLSGAYAYSLTIFIFTVYLSAVVTPTGGASSIIGFFLLMPLVVIDDSLRTYLVLLLYYGLFLASSFCVKPYNIAMDDMVTGGAFIIIGIVVGEYMKHIRLSNIDSRRRIKKISEYDELTGLSNRHRMIEFLQEHRRQNCTDPVTGVIMLDIDFFKRYNDSYGHVEGDRCLTNIGNRLKQAAQEYDMEFFRYGGEEFIAFNRGMDNGQLAECVRSITRAISDLGVPFEASQFGTVTVSAGFSEMTACNATSCEELIHMADMALYRAKANGRNIVIDFSDTDDIH